MSTKSKPVLPNTKEEETTLVYPFSVEEYRQGIKQ